LPALPASPATTTLGSLIRATPLPNIAYNMSMKPQGHSSSHFLHPSQVSNLMV
jgi:hypothetical protein